MFDAAFKHNDPDDCHDNTVILHDCIAEKIIYKNGILCFEFPDGIWVTPLHEANSLGETVRTTAARADFQIEDINDVEAHVYTRNIFKKTVVEFRKAKDLADAVNSGKCTLEFLYQYRTCFEQMWRCELHFGKKPYYRECQLHMPGATAVYLWNELRPDRKW